MSSEYSKKLMLEQYKSAPKPPSEFDYPEIAVWVTSCGRIQTLKGTIDSWIKHCTYPNYKIIIVESQMNDVSKQFFDLTHIHADETAEYLAHVKEEYPHVNIEVIIQPYQLLGRIYNQLLEKTGAYYYNIEDDLYTVCDPHDQLVDAIKVIRANPHILGVRSDLRDETWEELSPRFPCAGQAGGLKYMVVDFCSGGAQLMDAYRVRAIGGFIHNHLPKDYGHPERAQNAAMLANHMFIVSLTKYWGFVKHMGKFGICGGDRSWTNIAYDEMEKYGWFGDGSQRRPKPHTRNEWIAMKVDNGKL